jgi:hypothetical protein
VNAQERPQRRRRRQPATKQPAGAPRAQRVGVIDAVGAQHHRVDHRHHLASSIRGARTIAAQSHQPPCQRLDTQPLRERGDQHHTGVRHRPLVIKLHRQAVQSDGLVILHHTGDLLTQHATAPNGRFYTAQEVNLRCRPDGNRPARPVDPG